jgi:hypothetical protein
MTKKDYYFIAQLIKKLILKLEENNPKFDRKKFIEEIAKKEVK